MRCPKCNKYMQPDIKGKRYVCSCGNIINWMLSNDIKVNYPSYIENEIL